MTDKEKEVFSRKVSEEELSDVSGGTEDKNCENATIRDIYGGDGFPNCLATVEDGSFCNTNDACVSCSVVYINMKGCWFNDCHKAWK